MINKEQAIAMVKENEDKAKIERAEIVKIFCEDTADKEITRAAKLGERKATIGCATTYASEIANYLRAHGFAVHSEPINNGRNSNLTVTW